MRLHAGAHRLDLSRPVIMGILNTTPDSFSDGGHCYQGGRFSLDLALARARKMLDDGAAIIDIGGESTRPGAQPVSEQEELDRVVPVVEHLARESGALISVDTSTPKVMSEAARVGAGMINDIRALTREGAIATAIATGLPICLMHMQGEPETMQVAPQYLDPVAEVIAFLQQRIALTTAAGLSPERILLDPGFGFGKNLNHNLTLLRRLPEIAALGYPILVGLSRKSMLGTLLKREVDDRLPGSLALALLAAQAGASIIRVHDVAATADALSVLAAVTSNNNLTK
jgi:dihydropteroate synthase